MKIAWVAVNCLMCTWFSYVTLVNPVLMAVVRRWGSHSCDKAMLTLLVGMALVHCGVAGGIYLNSTDTVTVIATSLIAFAWVVSAYFTLQRFAAYSRRPMIVLEYPAYYPVAAFVAFALSFTACIVYGHWYLAGLPIGIWIILRFVCAQISIRS